MTYRKLVVVAPAWREKYDPDTDTMYLHAELSETGACFTQLIPVPGSAPVGYGFECVPMNCEDACELTEDQLTSDSRRICCVCSKAGNGGTPA